ncbi:hypothetical protein SO802_016909 [Lithocarpus litseifolius]|uniref:Uncharacterized protein n=1 Tax=Lithocarpus litseifolius TaxID=425828 RepID=A0AAW2D0C0_9ROSI
MITSLTHISSATPSFPAVVSSSVVWSQAKQPDVHVEHKQVVELPLPPQGRPKRTRKPHPCGTGGHKARDNVGPTGIPPVSKKLNGSDAWVAKLCKKLDTWWPWVAEGETPLVAAKGLWGDPWAYLQRTTEINGSLIAYYCKMDRKWWRSQMLCTLAPTCCQQQEKEVWTQQPAEAKEEDQVEC